MYIQSRNVGVDWVGIGYVRGAGKGALLVLVFIKFLSTPFTASYT